MLRTKEMRWKYLAMVLQQAQEFNGVLWNRRTQVMQEQLHGRGILQAGTAHLHRPWNIIWSSSPHHMHHPLLSGPHMASPHTPSRLLRFMKKHRKHRNSRGTESENEERL
jgi:hypothetical protein